MRQRARRSSCGRSRRTSPAEDRGCRAPAAASTSPSQMSASVAESTLRDRVRIVDRDVLEDPGEEIVAGQHADAVAVVDRGGVDAAARLRVVDDVVVDERRDVDELHVRGEVKGARRNSPPHASAASSVMRGRRRLPPAASMRLMASVMIGLSVVKRARKNRSTSACRSAYVPRAESTALMRLRRSAWRSIRPSTAGNRRRRSRHA